MSKVTVLEVSREVSLKRSPCTGKNSEKQKGGRDFIRKLISGKGTGGRLKVKSRKGHQFYNYCFTFLSC